MDVTTALRQARASTGLSQKALARRAGIAASSLSRYESSSAQPSLPTLDRLLATCDKDVRLVVVDRVDDLDALLTRRAGLCLHTRAGAVEFLRPSFLERLAGLGPGLMVAGSWAAELLGIPADPAPGRVLIADDPELFARLAAAFMQGLVPWRRIDGHFGSLPVRPSTFAEHPVAHWWQRDVGSFCTEVVAATGWPLERRIETGAGALRVLAAQELTDDDGVPAELLATWTAWRAAAGPDQASWREPAPT